MGEDTLVEDESRHAAADVGGPVASDPSGSSDGFKPSPKLRARIEKLAKWRIDPVVIRLRWKGSEYHGEHSAVSRAAMNSGDFPTNRRERISWWKEQDVVVKKMRVGDDTDFERVLQLTIREAGFLAKLYHPNIVEFLGFVEGAYKGINWLVFPWAWCGTLKDFIARKNWDIPERISLISDVAKGLEYLHTPTSPICHGDLKSLDVVIYGDGKDVFRERQIYAQITDLRRVIPYPTDQDPLMEDESEHAFAYVRGPVGSHGSVSSDGFEPSPKLRARIEKLAHLRMDPSFIDFKDGRVYHGGHATVSKGAMVLEHVVMWFLSRSVFLMQRRWFGPDPDVAVKKMRVADDTDFERVLGLTIREAEFLAKLSHKNIVPLEGFVEDVSKGTIWLVLPWAEHGNLKDFIAREKWDIPERISLINDVAQGLEYLHTRNPPVCHGDLKSLNVLIYDDQDDGRLERKKIYARITDFGSAHGLPQRDPNTQIEDMVTQSQSAQPPSAAFCASTKTITLTGNKYTLRWAAPELLLKDQLSLWSDIWALGWIVYEVMTGSLPFEDATSEMAVVECVIEGKLPSLTDNSYLLLIHELCSLVNMCWKVQPTQRPTAGSCRRSIEKMPMFPPEIAGNHRALSFHHLRQLGKMYQSRGEYARAFTFFVNSATGPFQPEDQIQGLRDLAQLARLVNEYSKTIAAYDGIWKIYERSDREDMDGLVDGFYDLADLHRLRAESKESGEIHYKGRDIEGQQRVAEALCAMALNHRLKGTHDKAIPLYSKVLEIRTNLGDRRGRAEALWGLADAHRCGSEYEKAIPLYFKVLSICTSLGDRKGRASGLFGLADVHRCRGEYDEAIPLYSEVLEIRTDLSDRNGRADALWGLADVHRRRSEYEEAMSLFSKVLKIRTDLDDRRGRADALWGLADVHRRRNEYEEAISLLSKVLTIRTNFGDRKGRVDALRDLAEVHRSRGEYEKAVPLYYQALGIWANIDDIERKGAMLLGLAAMPHDQGDDGEDLYPHVAEERSRRVSDPLLDDKQQEIRALSWWMRRIESLASDLTKRLPGDTAAPAWVSVQRDHLDESPSKAGVRAELSPL